MSPRSQLLTISSVSPQGSDAILLSFDLAASQQPQFRFQSGQYLTLAVSEPSQTQWRCYSIVTSPEDHKQIGVLVRRVSGGFVSNWFCNNARPGNQVLVLPPAGRFTLAKTAAPVLLYAGGSGIAPVFALAREALEQGVSDVRLFYANRSRASAMMMDELASLELKASGRLHVVNWYDDEQGLPTASDFMRLHRGKTQADVYLCGPDPFMKGVRTALDAAGVGAERIHAEIFSLAADSVATSSANGAPALLTIQLNGRAHQIHIRRDETLLTAMLREGVPAPHACRVGECASCMCRLVKGDVHRLESAALDEVDIAEGSLLACRSRVASDAVEVRFI